ncbi:hypothetical protein [Streptomyces sp. TP-A0356]|uniref:hypothetical protein n=1 Tax=Streptomyces sp. TP-A0356 TaxID=1359208 RepID=UPI0006E3A704|nr:hypothetical protein [Streptomyces sp. TP-A0356]
MRSRRILAAVIATAALAGLGLAGAATATAAPAQVSPSQCRDGGGTPRIDLPGNPCVGGEYNGQSVD